jgi:hypothetical protein
MAAYGIGLSSLFIFCLSSATTIIMQVKAYERKTDDSFGTQVSLNLQSTVELVGLSLYKRSYFL